MDPNGADSNPGTQALPVQTLANAISKVPSGGTVVARGGTYRDGSSASVNKSFTLQANPHEQVWFDGTDVVNTWTSAGNGQWYVDWDTPTFCAGHYYDYPYAQQPTANTGPCSHYDMTGDPANPAAGDPQMVFIDGTYIHEVTTTLAAATGANFFYDQTAKRLYLGTDPTNHVVELASRPVALVLQGGSGGNIVRGIGFRRYATNEYSGNITHGALAVNVPGATIESCVFTRNAGAGLHIANPTSAIVHANIFAANGFNGLDVNGHEHTTGATDNLDVENNIFNGNNTERFGTGCSASCASAGSKMSHMDGLLLKNNVFENGVGIAKGFWCDLACNNAVIVNNVFANNGDTGLMYEVSDTGIIASNLSYGNGAYGIKCGSANTKIYNNTLVNNSTEALMYDDSRSPSGSPPDVGPDSVNVEFVNNVLWAGANMVDARRTSSTGTNTGPNTFVTALDFNAYYRPNDTPTTLVSWRDGSTTNYTSATALDTAHGWESHALDITSGADPFFVDAANGDYRVRTSSAAYQSGTTLPSDVAAALGVSASAPISRGALSWPAVP